jgi:hypothetical protein
MPISRRHFFTEASALAMLATLVPELLSAQQQPVAHTADMPHDSLDFWGGFFDSVNPDTAGYGQASQQRGPKDQLPDPSVMTQYLQYETTQKMLRYATDVQPTELLDHEGDVAVSIALSQYRQADGEITKNPTQLRVDATQTRPFMNILSPLAWTALASLMPDKAGKIPSLDQLGFKSDQALTASSKILLNGGSGKLAVNISQAAASSIFVKALNVMMSAAKMAAPLVSLPAISVPALSSITEVLSYWEDRNKFIMAGNLTTVIATQQAHKDSERPDSYIGLVSGDYLMVPQKHTDALHSQLGNLDVVQGYLVAKDADPTLPIQSRAQNVLPGISYATMKMTVAPLDPGSSSSKPAATPAPAACPTAKAPAKKG